MRADVICTVTCDQGSQSTQNHTDKEQMDPCVVQPLGHSGLFQTKIWGLKTKGLAHTFFSFTTRSHPEPQIHLSTHSASGIY